MAMAGIRKKTVRHQWNGRQRSRAARRDAGRRPVSLALRRAQRRDHRARRRYASAIGMHLPKIIRPAVVCSTLVTMMSRFLPMRGRALSTTTIVPSSR